MGNSNPPSFCIVCPDRVIELVASSRVQMVEWVNEVEASLVRLGILKVSLILLGLTDGSNDSDFVSPQVIAELLLQRGISKNRQNSLILDSEKCQSTGDTWPEPCTEIYIDMSRSHMDHNMEVCDSLSPSIPPHLIASSTFELSQISASSDTSASVDNVCAVYTSPQSPESLDITIRSEEAVENTYSLFPCQQETPWEIIDSNDLAVAVVQQTQKPVALPRKTKPKTSSHVSSKTASAADENTNVTVSDSSCAWPTVEVYNNRQNFPPGEEMYNNVHNMPPPEEEMYNNVHELPPAGEEMYNNLHTLPPPGEEMYNNLHTLPPAGEEMYNNLHTLPPPGEEIYNNVHNLPPAGEEMYNNLPHTTDTYRNLHADDNCKNSVSLSAGTSILADIGMGGHEGGGCGDVYTNHKHSIEYCNMLNAEGDDSRGASPSQLPSAKDNHSETSKDENENFYGLVFDTGPPLTRAPPIPPLPSGHYSHSSSPPKDHRAASSSAKNPAASSLVQSAFHAASSNKCASLPSETTPPLLLPRKTNSFHASLPSSCTTNTESRDVLHKGSNLYNTLSVDDQPPALPSRSSQSFFIKRPQITGMSSSKITSSESSNKQAGNVSRLSRTMLLDRAHSLHTVVSLKQTQADILQTEISLPNVTLTITQKAGHGIALVDWNSFSCVVGWNQKDFPSLHGKLHLGDLVFSVNGSRVTSADTAQKLLKQAPSSNIELMLHRMPYAQVFAIHRSAEGQSLGIKRNGGTGEIIYVDPNGLAAQHGLTPYAQSVCGTGRCNWFLVEINNRPLSLFFKDDEIDHRLSAVGREISLVVQPSDFIYEIRRRFKKLRNYKQFITQ
ncbi:unnamed protein product [Candidula unifasciata]|uniref:Syntenin-1 n=1 Tax=Candidula unifasciata TaxID=100452 RepID=A0A8S3YPZ1_9EUPU|nr:unnamed protein product [Candidula unifasciata]